MSTPTAWPPTPSAPPEGARLAADLVDVDLGSGGAFAAAVPHDAFDELRRHGGIAWHAEAPVVGMMGDNPMLQFVDSPGFWAVTSHALVTEVDRDQHRFSSEAGGTAMFSFSDESLPLFRQMMLNMDHPQHSRLRRVLQPVFTPRTIERLRASIELNAVEILRDLDVLDAAGEGVDLVTAVAAEMPLRVLADLLGVPRADRHLLFQWSNAILAPDDPSSADVAGDSVTAFAEMLAYGSALAAERRAKPVDDLVSRIVTAEVEGERLSDTEFEMFWLLLVIAGNETTRNALSGAVVALHRQDQWSWLADHPEHLPSAVEELLRFVAPVQHFRRTAMADTVLGDQAVAAGEKVVIWFGAANRDPLVFADPHRLDLCRDPNPHVAFGVGPHFCLGAHLARLELSEMLGALLRHAPAMTVGEPVGVASNFINGIARLPVRIGRGDG